MGRERLQRDLKRVDHAEILDAVGRAKAFRLCLRRVWAVAASLPGRAQSLPNLIPSPDMFSVPSHSLQHHEHEQCTFDFCEHSRVDFTSVRQRHEENNGMTQCVGHCERLEFPLVPRMLKEKAAIWKVYDQSLLDASHPYMAISHVWADGTGAGTWGPGNVNECLWEFFCDIARDFQCEGCWWDTISIPTEDDARAKALGNMHNNYADARITLVHDLYLREWEWIDAETACFAIVMSPWYSRGWTALELAKSHKVKILFGARNDRYVIKDLDIDILAKVSQASSHYAIAESIRKLRDASIHSLGDLLSILGPRDTSKPRDLPIISGLLAGVDVDGGLSQQEIYQRILRKLGKVAHEQLFHNSATMSSPGFDWCPTNILDMPLADNDVELLDIRENGELEGFWRVYATDGVKSDNFIWTNTHPLTQIYMDSALLGEVSDQYVLLIEETSSPSRAILVRLIATVDSTACCHFVGPVYFRPALLKDKSHRKLKVRIGGTETANELLGPAWDHLMQIDKANKTTDRSSGPEDAEGTALFTIPTSFKDWKAIFYSDKGEFKSLFEDNYKLQISKGSGVRQNETRDMYYKGGCDDSISSQAFFYGHKSITKKVSGWLKNDQSYEEGTLMLLSLGEDDKIKIIKDDDSAKRSLAGSALLLATQKATQKDNSSKPETLVTLLLNHDAPHELERSAQNPLHLALEGGNERLIERLLTHQSNPANPDTVNANGETAIYVAAKIGHLNETVTRLLVENTKDPKTLDIQHGSMAQTALHLAAMKGNTILADQLIKKGASTNIPDFEEHIPLFYAASEGHNAIVTALLECSANFDNDSNGQAEDDAKSTERLGQSTTQESVEGGDMKSVEEHKAIALRAAAWKGHEPVVRTLIKHNADVFAKDSKGRTPLMLAAEGGSAPVVEALLSSQQSSQESGQESVQNNDKSSDRDSRIFPQEQLDRCLLLAAKGKHGKVISKLDDAGAKSNHYDPEMRSALHWAIEADDSESAKRLIKTQENLNSQDSKRQRSALILAAEKEMEELVRNLLEKGVNASLSDSGRRTALHWAALKGNLGIMKLLLDCENIQDFINNADNQGRRALHLAAYWRREKDMKLILDYHPQYETRDKDDRTPLMLAAECGNLEGVKQLLRKGVSPKAVDKEGMTALDLAATNGHEELVLALLPKVEDDKAREKALQLAVARHHLSVAMQLQKSINDATLRSLATSSILFLVSTTDRYPLTVANFVNENVIDPDRQNWQGRTALMLSIENGNLALTSALIDIAAKTELQDAGGKTALMMAASLQDYVNLFELQRAHADPSIQDKRGYTALHHAVEKGFPENVEILFHEFKIDPNIRDKHERTALHIAMDGSLRENTFLGTRSFWRVSFGRRRRMGNAAYDIGRLLIRYGARLDAKDSQGQTPLHLAARNYPQTAVALLKMYSESLEPDLQDAKKQTPLLLAAEAGHSRTMESLLRRGADPNLYDDQGRTPLSQAARNGHEDAVNVLLAADKPKLDLNARDAMGRTALLLAAENGHIDIVRSLVEHKANPSMVDFGRKKAWQKAMDKGFISIVEFLLPESNQNVGDRRDINEALLMASRRGWTPLANVLLGEGADPNFQNREKCTALHMAAMNGHRDMVEALLAKRSIFPIEDTKGRTALLQATEHGFGSIVGILLARKEVKADANGWKVSSALLLAAEKGYTKIVELILEIKFGVDLNICTPAGKTAMALAAANGNGTIVKSLLVRGADWRIRDVHERSALQHAAWGGCDDVVEILLKYKADWGALDKRQQTALHLAAERASDKVIQLLLENRVNVNAKSADGQTALHRAAWGGSYKVVALLCNNGADILVRDNSKNRPWQVAAEKGHESIVETLLGAEENLRDELILNKRGLIFAAEMGYSSIARSLLKRNADADTKDENGLTPLHWAMKRGDQAFVELLLEQSWRPMVNALDQNRQTPLCHGVLKGRATVVELLLRHGADPNIPDNSRRTVLHHAAREGNWEMVRVLVNHKADPHARDNRRRKAWQLAAEKGEHQTVQLLLDKEVDLKLLGSDLEELLLKMAEQGVVPMVELLLGREVNKDATDRFGRSAIGLAAENGRQEVLDLLLSKGANPGISDLRKRTPILWAAKAGNTQIISSLLEKVSSFQDESFRPVPTREPTATAHEDIDEPNGDAREPTVRPNVKDKIINHQDSRGRTALLVALGENHDNVVKLLVDKGSPEINVNLQDNTHTAALHLATQRDNHDLVRLLLSKGANQGLQDELGRTALLIAAERGNNKVVKTLVEDSRAWDDLSFDAVPISHLINLPDLQYQTALLVAAERGDKEMIEMLLRNGAEKNYTGLRKRTALLVATENGSQDVVDLLLKEGADHACEDSEGRTPLRLAVLNGDTVLVQAFLNHMDNDLTVESNSFDQKLLHLAVRSGNKEVAWLVAERMMKISGSSDESKEQE